MLTDGDTREANLAGQSDGPDISDDVTVVTETVRLSSAPVRAAVATQPAPRSPRWTRRAVLRTVALVVVWAVVFVAIAEAVSAGIQTYQSLSHARAHAADAVHRLDDLRALAPASTSSGGLSGLTSLLTPTKLNAATTDLTAAAADFRALEADLAPVGPLGVARHAPIAGDALTSADLLADAGDQGCRAGLLLLGDAHTLLDYLNGGVFANGKPSTLTAAALAKARADLGVATQELDRAIADINAANLNAIPSSLLKPKDVTLLREVAAKWPTERARLTSAEAWLAVAPALLGIGSPSQYLIEIMDSSELRPGGGFIGNYTILTLTGAQVEPFTLQDVYLLDRPYLASVGYYAPAPAQYSWWPWPTYFGLRDSNLSPDFPTNAQVAMRLLHTESGQTVQGVMAITPAVIQRVLQVVGPIPMPLYNVTVTSANLVSLIEYYQLAVSPQTDLPPSDQISSASKRFVALLGRALLDKLHGLTLSQLVAIGQTMLTDVQQKDLQIYLADPASEALLAQTGYAGATPHGPGDAVTINDANDGVNKASQFTTAAYQDSVSIDAQGNVTHDLTITYRFHATDPTQLYGPDRYQTYLRVYAPSGARLIKLTGLHNILGDDQLNHSDLAWRQMWGGYVIVADGVPSTLHFEWVVPHAATRDSHGHWRYTLAYQRQAGATQTLQVTVSAAGQRQPLATFSGPLVTDLLLSA